MREGRGRARSIGLLLVAASVASLALPVTFGQTPHDAATRLDNFLDRFPDLGPGSAVVTVTADEVLLRQVAGQRRALTNASLSVDTLIYIASQTKAYIGLLAARLDAEGIIGLDDRITDHWPDVNFPQGVDPSEWSLRDLLAHSVPIEVEHLGYLEAYVTELSTSDYPEFISTYGSAREPGYQYDNLGYNIWAAILETATGKSWREWLDEKLIDPLGLANTSSRTSNFSLDQLSWSHIWQGEEAGWYEIPPKPDELMQSAGGLVASVNDMAIWLQANLRGAVIDGTGITTEMVERAHAPVAMIDPEAPNGLGLPCSGYALGWNVCDFQGNTVYIHGGSYPGSSSIMAFSPGLGAGIGVFTNSASRRFGLSRTRCVSFPDRRLFNSSGTIPG